MPAGSSPQVRGKRTKNTQQPLQVRLIPAGAGKTAAELETDFRTAAHPRRCGENRWGNQPDLLLAGSSPQVRGKRQRRGRGAFTGRLIPAGAGKTLADMELYPHIASFRISLEPKASINPT